MERVAPSAEPRFNYLRVPGERTYPSPEPSYPCPSGSPERSPLTELPHRKMFPFRSPPFIYLLISVGVPNAEPSHDRGGIILIHQVEPPYLVRLNTTGRSPGVPEGAVSDRLTYCHLFLRHGTHTVGLEIVFQCLRF